VARISDERAKMMTSSGLVDGSWELSVAVTNLQTAENVPTERMLRVKGDLHVGGVMLKLVEDLGTVWKLTQLLVLGKMRLVRLVE